MLILNRMDIEKVLSCDSFYTLTYLIESYLKKEKLEKDKRISELRRILNGLLLEYYIESEISVERFVLAFSFHRDVDLPSFE